MFESFWLPSLLLTWSQWILQLFLTMPSFNSLQLEPGATSISHLLSLSLISIHFEVFVLEAKDLFVFYSYVVVLVCAGVIWFSSMEARMRSWLLGYLNHSFHTLNILKIRFPKEGIPSNFAHQPKMLLGSPKALLRGNESNVLLCFFLLGNLDVGL